MPFERTPTHVARWSAAALGAAWVVLVLHVAGALPSVALGQTVQAPLFRALDLGYRLDEARRALAPPLQWGLALLALAATAGLAWRLPRVALGVVLLPALGLVTFAAALEPVWFGLLGLGLVLRGPLERPVAPRTGLAAAVCLSPALWNASLLATHSRGTAFDGLALLTAAHPLLAWSLLAVLLVVFFAWSPWRLDALPPPRALGAAALTALGLALSVAGDTSVTAAGVVAVVAAAGTLLPRGPAEGLLDGLASATLVAWGVVLLETGFLLPACSDLERPGVHLLAADRGAFDVAAGAAGVGASYRPERVLRVVHEGEAPVSVPFSGGEPEEVVALPRGFLVTVAPEEPDAGGLTELWRVEGSRARRVPTTGLCGIASSLWEEDRGTLLLGCENEPLLYRYHPESQAVEGPLAAELTGDVEDLATDGEHLFVVPLVHGNRLLQLDRETRRLQAAAPVGSVVYTVEWAPQAGRVFASSFVQGGLLVFAPEPLERVAHVRTGLGTRALGIATGRGREVAVVGSMLRSGPTLVDTRTLERTRLDLGGLVKGLHVESDGRVRFSSTCGLLELDLDELLRSRGP